MDEEKKEHMTLSVGCPNVIGGGHGAFRVEDGKFICDCGADFTSEAVALEEGLRLSLKK